MKRKITLVIPFLLLCACSSSKISSSPDFSFSSNSTSSIVSVVKAKHHLITENNDSSFSRDFPASGDYEEGSILCFKVQIVTDISMYVYLDEILVTPVSSDYRVGGYDYYEITMPGYDAKLILVSNEYQPLWYILPWTSSVSREELTSVIITKGPIGVLPEYSVTSEEKSTDSRDLDTCFDYLKTETVYKNWAAEICGGSYVHITYYFGDNISFTLKINNDVLLVEQEDSETEEYCITDYPELLFPDAK